MKKIIYCIILGCFVLSGCQETEFGPQESPENGVTKITFVGQTVDCVVSMVPALENEKKNTITVSLVPGTNFSAVEVKSITVSSGATTGLKAGDKLDLNQEYVFSVTAANGLVRNFNILPPKKFNSAEQGPQLTSADFYGNTKTMSLGQWLCYGQNRTFDIDPNTGDTVGFFRCDVAQFAPFVSVNKSETNSLTTYAGDRDDYFIFKSNGTYEFSYGKDALSSSLTGNATYRGYLVKSGKGYWQIGEGKNFLVADRKPTDQGLYLTDGATGEKYFFGFVNIATGGYITIQGWPLNDSSLRIAYKFGPLYEDWNQWLVNY